MIQEWITRAYELGFSAAGSLDVGTLKPMSMVRDMCAEDKCRAYNRNWTCPPACGTLEQCTAQLHQFQSGILLQTVGQLKKRIDSKGIMAAEKHHKELFMKFCMLVRAEYPEALCLGVGACTVCQTCAYPKSCRFPGKAHSSMEAYGLFVTQVCRDNRMAYHHGDRTITYTSCVLFE